MKINRTKAVLIFFVSIYGLALAFFIIQNIDFKRHIVVEKKQQSGVVVINNKKYKTPYQIERVQISVEAKNALDYLFLSTGNEQESFIGAITKLAIVILAVDTLLRVDFAEPFQLAFAKRLRQIFILYIVVVILAWIRSTYTGFWIADYLRTSGYGYKESIYGFGLYLTIIILGALLHLYHQAVENKQELELTI